MALPIVDRLEMIDVQQNHHRLRASIGMPLSCQSLQRASVQQAGQLIGIGQFAQLAGQCRTLVRLRPQHLDGIEQALHFRHRVGGMLLGARRVRGDLDHLRLRLQQRPQDLHVGDAQCQRKQQQCPQHRSSQHGQAYRFLVAGVLEARDRNAEVAIAQRFQRLQGGHVARGELGRRPGWRYPPPAIFDQLFHHRQRLAEQLPARHVPMPGQRRLAAEHRFVAGGQPPQLQQAALGLLRGAHLRLPPRAGHCQRRHHVRCQAATVLAQVDQDLPLHGRNRGFAIGGDQVADLHRRQRLQPVVHREHAVDRVLHLLCRALAPGQCGDAVHRSARGLQPPLRFMQARCFVHRLRVGLEHGLQVLRRCVHPLPGDHQLCGQPALLLRIGAVGTEQTVGRSTLGRYQIGQLEGLPQLPQADQVGLGFGVALRALHQRDGHQRQRAQHEQASEDPEPGLQSVWRCPAAHRCTPWRADQCSAALA
ncbi:hypothetical protein D3C73_724780 [compost metagenome]